MCIESNKDEVSDEVQILQVELSDLYRSFSIVRIVKS